MFNIDELFTTEETLLLANQLGRWWSCDEEGMTAEKAKIMFKIGNQAGLALQIDKWIEHERKRWRECDWDELHDRALKIKNPLKLRAFILTAQQYQSQVLYKIACTQARKLGYGWILPRGDTISKLSKDGKVPEPPIRKIRT